MATITIDGADKLVKNISRKVDKNEINHVIKRNTAQAQRNAMKYAPVADVNGGSLKRSIIMEMDFPYMEGRIIAGMDYAAYQEYGTRFQTGTQFMRPARNEQAPIFMNDLRNLIRKG